MKSYYSEELSARVCYEEEAQAEIDRLKADLFEVKREYVQRQEWSAEQTEVVINGLKEEIDELKSKIKPRPAYDYQRKRILSLQAEIEELKPDVERYRWMRDEENWGADNVEWFELGQLSLGDFDSYVDELIAKHKGE